MINKVSEKHALQNKKSSGIYSTNFKFDFIEKFWRIIYVQIPNLF